MKNSQSSIATAGPMIAMPKFICRASPQLLLSAKRRWIALFSNPTQASISARRTDELKVPQPGTVARAGPIGTLKVGLSGDLSRTRRTKRKLTEGSAVIDGAALRTSVLLIHDNNKDAVTIGPTKRTPRPQGAFSGARRQGQLAGRRTNHRPCG
jgi:hypothetical protein